MGLKNNFKKTSFIILLLILILQYFPSISAENYYADISIDVDSSGFVTISGITNHPDLLVENTENYTSKKQSYWLLNITKGDVFSDFIYVLTLQEGSSINYIKSSGFIRIEENNGKLQVIGIGENESFSLLIQYETKKMLENQLIDFGETYLILIFTLILLIIILASLLIRNKNKVVAQDRNRNDLKGLNQRQKEIMKLLSDTKIPLTQTDIQKELNIPKAAVSRNIHGLEIKGLIEKEQIGMSNLIRIKKP